MSPPTPEIQEAVDLIKELVCRLIDASSQVCHLGAFESDVAVANLLKLLIRHVQGVLCYAKQDLLLLPPALVISRSALEISVNILWMLDSEDPFHRELCLLALLKEEEQGYKEYIKNIIEFSEDASEVEIDKENVQKYREAIKRKIPNSYREISKPKNFRDLLRSLNIENIYPIYRILSKYTHGTHSATWLYKRSLGEDEEFGELIYPSDWHTPLYICWHTIAESGCKFLSRFGGTPNVFLPGSFRQEVQQAVDELRIK